MFSSRSFLVFGLILRSLIHLELIFAYSVKKWVFSAGSAGKESAYNVGDLGSISGLKNDLNLFIFNVAVQLSQYYL